MSSKSSQLLLEICLLRLRYSASEIQELARVESLMADPAMRDIVNVLTELQLGQTERKSVRADRNEKKAVRTTRAKTKRAPSLFEMSNLDAKTAIPRLAVLIADRRILRSQEQLSNFARSIGINSQLGDRREYVNAIREKLASMPTAQALDKIKSLDSLYSGSRPFVDLAKTLMRS